ncbi:MAG: hypothetical protein EXR98_10755 [Gemmataceae bacterium]|nr:hypothetical protein [Gemmataceae bacterium]
MKPARLVSLLVLALLAGALSAQDGPQKGVIKKTDAAKSTLAITADGKDLTLTVTPKTRVMTAAGQKIEDPFKDKAFTVGAAILFLADDKGALIGIRIGGDAKQPPGGGIRRAKIGAIDLDKLTVTLKTPDKDIEAIANEQTQFFEAKGKDVKQSLQAFKVGADVMFVVQPKDGKNYLAGLRAADAVGKQPTPIKVDSSKFVPLNELGDKEYKGGYKGGFYPDGKNERPKAHEDVGLRLAKQVGPRDAAGKPDANGKIVLLSVGMSNTSQASQGFQKALAAVEDRNPTLVFVNGAQGGMTAARIQNPDNADGAKYWSVVDQQLKKAGVTREQVQVVWIKQADAGPREGFPAYAKKLEDELANIVQLLPKRFPNAKLTYLSSRTYAGYATTGLNPEPYAYESAFSVKWLIERQLKGESVLSYAAGKAPWLSWGPYLWANGSKKRADGFSYEQADFAQDGTHHSPAGSDKIGRLMVQFFQSDTTTRTWFVRDGK